MFTYKIAEKFVSINGEGTKAGQPAVFIRFAGCNLNCSYCDTKWANKKDMSCAEMTSKEIISYIKSTEIKNVTVTGGEPLIQKNIKHFLETLSKESQLHIEIETNGSVDLTSFFEIENRPSFTMDYKLGTSGMETFMIKNNLNILTKKDTIKFVAGNTDDLNKAKEIIDKYKLYGKTNIYLSPVFGSIQPVEIVKFMLKNKMNDVNLQLQMHKIIWPPEMKGV